MNRDRTLSGPATGGPSVPAAPAKRPSRWSPANWPVRWKVLAIVLVPLLLAGGFGAAAGAEITARSTVSPTRCP